jgi:3-deoxy-manno-octulosonate cytidylyltransferase (CMP-KDO synthetase)
MTFTVIVPARWASTRLPGKMLADIGGEPMIARVVERARRSNAKRVIVATDSEAIAQALTASRVEVIMTDEHHMTGTDRLAQACEKLALAPDTVVVNVQGDEPLIEPELINEVARALLNDDQAAIATCASPITDPEKLNNPNVVKVVCDAQGHALYFSRAPIPYCRNPQAAMAPLHHVGIYAYRVRFLRAFPKLTAGLLETAESLEQLRALEHGFKIRVSVTPHAVASGVDTPEDLIRVRQFF